MSREYTIQFAGSLTLNRPLLPAQAAYLNRFFQTRRVTCSVEHLSDIPDPLREAVGLPLGTEGAYFVGIDFDKVIPDARKSVADLRELVKTGAGVDPFKDFSEAAREELRAFALVWGLRAAPDSRAPEPRSPSAHFAEDAGSPRRKGSKKHGEPGARSHRTYSTGDA